MCKIWILAYYSLIFFSPNTLFYFLFRWLFSNQWTLHWLIPQFILLYSYLCLEILAGEHHEESHKLLSWLRFANSFLFWRCSCRISVYIEGKNLLLALIAMDHHIVGFPKRNLATYFICKKQTKKFMFFFSRRNTSFS